MRCHGAASVRRTLALTTVSLAVLSACGPSIIGAVDATSEEERLDRARRRVEDEVANAQAILGSRELYEEQLVPMEATRKRILDRLAAPTPAWVEALTRRAGVQGSRHGVGGATVLDLHGGEDARTLFALLDEIQAGTATARLARLSVAEEGWRVRVVFHAPPLPSAASEPDGDAVWRYRWPWHRDLSVAGRRASAELRELRAELGPALAALPAMANEIGRLERLADVSRVELEFASRVFTGAQPLLESGTLRRIEGSRSFLIKGRPDRLAAEWRTPPAWRIERLTTQDGIRLVARPAN